MTGGNTIVRKGFSEVSFGLEITVPCISIAVQGHILGTELVQCQNMRTLQRDLAPPPFSMIVGFGC